MMNEEIVRSVERDAEHDKTCIMCLTPTRGRGVFFPNDPVSQGLGAPPKGKVRLCIYPICESCVADHRDDATPIEVRMREMRALDILN